MEDRSDDPSHHERTLLPRSYISLIKCLYQIIIKVKKNEGKEGNDLFNDTFNIFNFTVICSGGAGGGGIAAWGQIYMGALISVVKIHLRAYLRPPPPPPFAQPLVIWRRAYYGKVPLRERERKPVTASTWDTLSD